MVFQTCFILSTKIRDFPQSSFFILHGTSSSFIEVKMHLSFVLIFFQLLAVMGNEETCWENVENILLFPLNFARKGCHYNHVLKNTEEMIKENGYGYEYYNLRTKDEYELSLIRIPTNRVGKPANKQPVFLLHGILCSSSSWTYKGNNSLAFYLAENGYDVWLGSVRGCPYCRPHKMFPKTVRSKFWEFSLDNVAEYDIPIQLQFIADKTNKGGSIIYLGYSMGSTLGFMYASTFPKEAERLLSGMISLAPAVYLTDIPIARFHPMFSLLKKILEALDFKGLIVGDFFKKKVLLNGCIYSPYICKKIMAIIAGKFHEQFHPKNLLQLLEISFEATSAQLLFHYAQILITNKFSHFDYGEKVNLKMYNQTDPPNYDFGKVHVPVLLLYGRNDHVSTEMNIKRLWNELGSERKTMKFVPSYKHKDASHFNHLDFLIANDIKEKLYKDVLEACESFS